jgi:WXG100 family type VII secretion target
MVRHVEIAGSDVIKVTPEALMSVSSEFTVAADQLIEGFTAVNREVEELLGNAWKGAAATEFSGVWSEWHTGAGKVHAGLTDMAELLRSAAVGYQKIDQSGARAVESTGR